MRVTARAPVIDLGSVQVHVRGENTSEGWHAWGPVSTLLIRSALAQRDDLLLGEISDIVHGDSLSWSRRLQVDWGWSEDISLMSFALATSWATKSDERNAVLTQY